MGFYVQTSPADKTNFLREDTLSSCLYYPFNDIDSAQRIDPITHTELGVIKIRWTDMARQIKLDLPKYLCLAGSKQTKQVIHYPANYDWHDYLDKKATGIKPIFFTEGFKKSLKAGQEKIPCIALWSVWCFSEGKLNETSLIQEIIDLIKTNCNVPSI